MTIRQLLNKNIVRCEYAKIILFDNCDTIANMHFNVSHYDIVFKHYVNAKAVLDSYIIMIDVDVDNTLLIYVE